MELLDKAQRWADHDPDPATASSLKADIEAARGGDGEDRGVVTRAAGAKPWRAWEPP